MNTFQYSSQFQIPKEVDPPIQYFIEELQVEEDEEMDVEDFNDEDENGNSSLIFAVLQGKEDLVRALVDQGAFVNHQNLNGETALYWASSSGLEQIVDILVENGANLNICNLDGASPAHVAASNGHCGVLRRLVQNGAYINAQDEDNDSVLHYAVREGQREVVEFLVRVCNAKMDVKNEDSETPLELAECLEPCCNDGQYAGIVKFLSEASSSSSPSKEVKFTKNILAENSFKFSGNISFPSSNLIC